MYEGYLALGGGEVLNSARSVGYTTTVDCPVNWLVCPPCPGIVDALGHNPYHYDNISEAPWYDEQDEPTHRFLGAHGISFEGIPDSTREAEVAEGILDGGVVGRVRNATRRIRVRAMLTALGEDALEVGFSWLNSALTPGRCGLHGDSCGAADARFYAACPPAREEVTTPLPIWNDPVTNLVLNPSMETPGPEVVIGTNFPPNPSYETITGMDVELRRNLNPNPRLNNSNTGWSIGSNAGGGITITPSASGMQVDGAGAAGNGSSGRVILENAYVPITSAQAYVESLEIHVPNGSPAVTLSIHVQARKADGTVEIDLSGPQTTIQPNQSIRLESPVVGPGSGALTEIRQNIMGPPTAAAAGTKFFVRKVMLEKGSVHKPYFDGSMLPAGDFTYLWVGTPDASASVENGKIVADTPAPVGAVQYQTGDDPADRGKAMRFLFTSGGSVLLPLTTYLPTAGVVYTMIGKVRPNNRDMSLRPQLRQASVSNFTAPKGVWTEFRVTLASGGGPVSDTGFYLQAGGAVHKVDDTIDVDSFMIVEGTYAGPYFDGSTADDPDLNYAWAGATDASASTVSVVGVANIAVPPSDQAKARQTTDSPARGAHALRYVVQTAPAVGLSATDLLPDTGTVYTLVGKVRPRTRDEKLAPRIRAAVGPVFTAPKDVWTPFRLTIAAGSGAVQQTGLLLASNSGHQPEDVIDIDEVLLIEGEWEGPYFDGDYPDSSESDYSVPGTLLHEFSWTGTPNASTSEFRTGNVTSVEDPEAYEQKLLRMVRNLHTVTCVAGPTVIQKYHRGDTWGYQVEFVLVAAVPWMYGDTRPVELLPSIPIVIQDVPFNLVPYPSAELADGSVIAATNYVKNPSLEVNTTDWTDGSDGTVVPSADVVLERTTELEAHGSASARAKFTATTSGTNGYFYVNTTVPLPDLNDLTRFSVNLWATASIESGTAVLGNLEHIVYWQNASGSTLREDDIHTGAVAGGAFSLKSTTPPPVGTTRAILRALVRVTSFSTGAVIRLYADAAAITVP